MAPWTLFPALLALILFSPGDRGAAFTLSAPPVFSARRGGRPETNSWQAAPMVTRSSTVASFSRSTDGQRGCAARAARRGNLALGMAVADVEFERQELLVIFDTMEKNKVFFSALGGEQKEEILKLLVAMTDAGEGSVDTRALAKSGALVGKWRLEFSTEERYRILPPGADLFNHIYERGETGRLDNILRFYNSWVLRNIRAVAEYKVDSDGRILFMFRQLMPDFFGFKLPLPFFGETGGYIEMQYFDGTFWVERFEEELLDESGSHMAYNVWRRIGDLTEADKSDVPVRQ